MFHCYRRGLSCFLSIFFLFSLFFLLATSNAYSADVALVWNANTESSLGGYNVYYGNASRSYQYKKDAKLSTIYTVSDSNLLPGNTYYFAVKAYDKNMNESDYSNEVSWKVPTVTPPTVNSPPVAVPDSAITTQNNYINVNVIGNDSDPDKDILSVSAVSTPSLKGGTASVSGSNVLYTPPKDFYGTDSFSYTVTDGRGGTATATVNVTVNKTVDANPTEPVTGAFPVIETGQLVVDSNWNRVSFTKTFSNPVVVAKPASFNDPDPCIVRIQNVNSTGFEIRIQEWTYLDDIHGQETVDFIVMEQGSYSLPDGTMLEAGRFETGNTGTNFTHLGFSQSLNEAPVLLTSVISYNSSDAVTTRIRNLTTTGFDFVMQEQESKYQYHPAESVCYIAWEPSSGLLDGVRYQVFRTGSQVSSNWYPITYPEPFDETPKCIADFQTANSLDTVAMRYDFKDNVQMEIKAEEETSKDSEVYHPNEVVGIICVEDASETKGLVAAYNFDEGSGTILYDRSGNGNHGSISGANWRSSGKFGGALSFDGSNDWVTINDSHFLDLSTGMTLEAWVYPRTLSSWRTVILKEGLGVFSYGLCANSDSSLPGVFATTNGEIGLYGQSQLPATAWTHLAGTYDGATLKLYVNGTQVNARSVSQSLVRSSGPMRIGGNSLWGQYFNGLIDDVRIYNRALSSSEIVNDMKSGVALSSN